MHKTSAAYRGILLLLLVVAVGVCMSVRPVYAGSAYVEAGAGYKAGDFGTPVDSQLAYIITKVGYFTENYEFNAAVPYLFLRNETGAIHETNSGLGDVVLRAGGYLAGESQTRFSLYGSVAVKLPTAEQEKGLGTGEIDYGAFLTINKKFDGISLWVTGGAIKVGSPAGQDFNDIFSYGAGISREFKRSRIYLAVDGYRQIVPESEASLSAQTGMFYILSPNYSMKGDVRIGLTEGAPDYGASFSLVRFFH